MSVSCMRTTFTEFTEPVKNLYAEQKLKSMESLNKGFPVKKKITYTTVNNLYAFLTACKSSFIWFYGIEKSNAVSDLVMILDSAMESPLYWIIIRSFHFLLTDCTNYIPAKYLSNIIIEFSADCSIIIHSIPFLKMLFHLCSKMSSHFGLFEYIQVNYHLLQGLVQSGLKPLYQFHLFHHSI